jgi:membrane fusion protein, multidrug efflux system
MNQKRLKIALPFLFLAAAIVITAALVAARPEAEREERVEEPPLVRVIAVQPRDVPMEVTSQGTVRSNAETTLVAQVAGKVQAVAAGFATGGTFRTGTPLAQLDPRDHQVALAQAEAALAQARLRLSRETAEAQVAREEWSSLGEGQPSALVLREPQLAEARSAVAAAEASILQARLNIERSTIRAPFDGILLEKHADLGQFVSPGTPLARIAASDYAEVELPVTSDNLAFIDLGSNPGVILRGHATGAEWPGRIVRTSGQIDPATRMLALIARVERPFTSVAGRQPLRIGEFVGATIEGRTVQGIITIPRGAVRNRNQVLVVDPAGRLQFRTVSVLRMTESEALIDGGLTPGERVVLSPMEAPVEGMVVRTTDAAAGEPIRIVPVGEQSR